MSADIPISRLSLGYLDEVDHLMKRNSATLGFLPREALRKSYFERSCVLGAIAEEDVLAGYLLYYIADGYFRITHLCVAESFQKRGIARRLVEELKRSATTQKSIRLNCRRDFPASRMWPRLGFVPFGDRPGRSAAGYLLTDWRLLLAPENQLSLFQEKVSSDALDVVIDAQIFFHLNGPDSPQAQPTKALRADFLLGVIKFWITDELDVEIDRNPDQRSRKASAEKSHTFPKIEYEPQTASEMEKQLQTFLPHGSDQDISDIRHVARTAASSINTFITQDLALLRKSAQIGAVTGVRVLSPVELIIGLHELSSHSSYKISPITSHAHWKRVDAETLGSLLLESFLQQGERKGPFREALDAFLAHPDQYEADLLQMDDMPAAIRVFEIGNRKLTLHLARVARPAGSSLLPMYLIAEIIRTASERNLGAVFVPANAITSLFIPHLINANFQKVSNGYVRYCLPYVTNRAEALETIAMLRSEDSSLCQNMDDSEFERHCSPMCLKETDQRYFLVPIKPGYALSLFDRSQSANDLFGGHTDVLLRWDNVYYRSKTCHRMLAAPARILWYVSGEEGRIKAISHLDQVEVGPPKKLYRKFKHHGIFEWKEIFELCHQDPSTEIMAMRFSHTFLFPSPILLDEVTDTFKKNGLKLSLRAPVNVPAEIFRELFRLGFHNQA